MGGSRSGLVRYYYIRGQGEERERWGGLGIGRGRGSDGVGRDVSGKRRRQTKTTGISGGEGWKDSSLRLATTSHHAVRKGGE